MRRIVLALFLFALTLPNQAWAAPVCACYFGEKNDCLYESLNDGAQETECEAACKSKYPNQLNTFQFNESTFGAILIFSDCANAHNLATESKQKIDPVVPKLNVPIPGLVFTPVTEYQGETYVNFLGDYIAGVYKYLIGFATIAAVVMLLIGGLQYAVGGAASEQIAKAKGRIKNAVTGLVLLLSVILIVEIINPELTKIDPLRLRTVAEIPPEAKDDPGDIASESSLPDAPKTPTGGKYFDGGQICGSPADCVKWCENNSNPNDWPDANKKTIDPSLTQVIPSAPGLKPANKSVRATKEMIEALKKAGQIAIAKNPNYFIQVQSGFRPLKTQIKIVCDKIKKAQSLSEPQQSKVLKEIGVIVAYPGGSNHGSGMAVDVTFWEGNKQLVTSSNKAQGNKQWKEGAGILADIMADAGLVRYAKEIWHFELEGKTTSHCRCKGSAQCPFPATCSF